MLEKRTKNITKNILHQNSAVRVTSEKSAGVGIVRLENTVSEISQWKTVFSDLFFAKLTLCNIQFMLNFLKEKHTYAHTCLRIQTSTMTKIYHFHSQFS